MSMSEMHDALKRAHNAAKNAREAVEQATSTGLDIALATATGFGLGYADKKWGKTDALGLRAARIPGTDIELCHGLAVVGGLLATSGMAGKSTDEIAALAQAGGAISGWKIGYAKTEAGK